MGRAGASPLGVRTEVGEAYVVVWVPGSSKTIALSVVNLAYVCLCEIVWPFHSSVAAARVGFGSETVGHSRAVCVRALHAVHMGG